MSTKTQILQIQTCQISLIHAHPLHLCSKGEIAQKRTHYYYYYYYYFLAPSKAEIPAPERSKKSDVFRSFVATVTFIIFKMCILTTPFSQRTDMRSSTPLTPFGMLRKSSFPSAFCSPLNVQLSVPVSCRSLLEKRNHTHKCMSLIV